MQGLKLTTPEAEYRLRKSENPPGNRLERLKGRRAGQHSIRANDQYRLCFRWESGYADDVEVTDYHS